MRLAEPRVAFVVPRYGPNVVGGAETLCRLMAENLAGHGSDVRVLSTCAVDHFTWANHYPPGTRVERGVAVSRFPVSGDRDSELFWQLHTAIALGRVISYAEQLEWMSNSVWSEGLQRAVEAARDRWILGIPYLFGTAFWAAAAHPARTALIPCTHDEPHAWLPVVQDALAGVAGCMANSDSEAELIARLAPQADVRVVGVGFEHEEPPDEQEVAAFCSSHGMGPGYLLYAGRREAAKGLPLLFEHYARYRDGRAGAPPLALMGSGDLPVPDEIADHVVELGFVPGPQRGLAYAGASVLLHPSTLESFGMVLLEAWLAGTPVLVNGGSPVLVDHCRRGGGGLWFDDAAEFDDGLDLLLEDPGLRDRMASGGAAYALETYSWAEVRQRFYDALVSWS
jgi:glycosyltransferase involved in cell wall biosynthesis